MNVPEGLNCFIYFISAELLMSLHGRISFLSIMFIWIQPQTYCYRAQGGAGMAQVCLACCVHRKMIFFIIIYVFMFKFGFMYIYMLV